MKSNQDLNNLSLNEIHRLNVNCQEKFSWVQQIAENQDFLREISDKTESLTLGCRFSSLSELNEFKDFLINYPTEGLQLSHESYKCETPKEDDQNSAFECIFIFSPQVTLSSLKLRKLSNTTEEGKTTLVAQSANNSRSLLDLDMSTTTIITILGSGFLISVVVIVICLRVKNKKKAQKDKGDRQKLVIKNNPQPASFPELTTPCVGQNLQPIGITSEPNTALSPLNYLRPSNLRLEENYRSSLVPDDIILTNIDNSPESASETSSQASAKNQPKTLDFNIEFSMVEQESIMKIKKNTESKKLGY